MTAKSQRDLPSTSSAQKRYFNTNILAIGNSQMEQMRKRMMNCSAKLKKIGEVKKEEVVGKRLLKRIQTYPAL